MAEANGDVINPDILNQRQVYDADTAARIPEPLSGQDTAGIVAEAYGVAGPRLGARLVESNIVLTIAGARGQTEFYVDSPTDEDRENIAAISKVLVAKGIRFSVSPRTFISPTSKKETLIVNIESLRGFEKVSRMTKIPGIPPYYANTGWEGLKLWSRACYDALDQAAANGTLPYGEENVDHIFAGIIKGYPDVAVIDLMEMEKQGKLAQSTESNIPHAGQYGGADPNFNYDSSHWDESSIKQLESSWGKILEGFYQSDWHQGLTQDPTFVETRKKLD